MKDFATSLLSITFTAALVGGCSQGASTGRASATAGVSAVSSLLPVRVLRPTVTTWNLLSSWSGTAGVSALGPVPGEPDEVLVAYEASAQLARFGPAGPQIELQTLLDPVSIASLGTEALAGTGAPHAVAGAGVYRRDARGAWSLAFDPGRGACVVGAAQGVQHAIAGDDGRPEADVATSTGGGFAVVSSLTATAPLCAVEHQGELWVGGRSTLHDGAPRLWHGQASTWQQVALPVTPAADEALSVVALAETDYGVLFAALAGVDAQTGQPTRGVLVAIRPATLEPVVVATRTGDAFTSLAAADGTVYAGARSGALLWLDEGGALQDEPTTPPGRVVALLAQGGTLVAGARGTSGSEVFVRNSLSGMLITSITPPTGLPQGGDQVEVYGVGFPADAQASLGGAPLTGVVVDPSGTKLTGMTSPRAAGTVDVVVTSPTLGQVTLPSGFTYGTGGPTYTEVQQRLVQQGCVSCHQQLNLAPLGDYMALRALLVPGNPGQSRLFQKVDVGGTMRGYLGANDPERAAWAGKIHDWIAAGAPNN